MFRCQKYVIICYFIFITFIDLVLVEVYAIYRTINHKVASSIPGREKLCCVLGQGNSPYLPRGECPPTYCKLLWIRASAFFLNTCRPRLAKVLEHAFATGKGMATFEGLQNQREVYNSSL